MDMNAHYDDESLFRYADGTSPIAGEIEAHVRACSGCRMELDEHIGIVDALKSGTAWEPSQPASPVTAAELGALAARMREEDGEAAALCDTILSGPSAWWPTRLRKEPNARSAGMVRQLISRAREVVDKSPPNALHITELAIELAEELCVSTYPGDTVIVLRGQAWREHAYILSYTGRLPQAIEACDHAESLFRQTPIPEYELARLKLVRSYILQELDRLGEAADLVRQAAETFGAFGDRTRHANARIVLASIFYRTARSAEALAIWESLQNDPAVQPDMMRIGIRNNIGAAYRELGQFDKAVAHLQQAIAEFEMIGADVERIRSRWALGRTLLAAQRTADAIPLLREVWREFEAVEMESDAAQAALDMAEALLYEGRAEQVPAICRALVDRFTKVGMTSRAITALAFLREAVALGQTSPTIIGHVRDFLEKLPAQPKRLFAVAPTAHRFDD